MASIEVSLSSTTATPRRKKASQPLQRNSRDTARELETLRSALRDKENVIQSLKGQLSSSPSIGRLAGAFLRSSAPRTATAAPVGEVERRAAGDRLVRLRQDMDNKRLAIKNLALALERLDVSDNIDVRIQQAELEFQLGREELNLLSLLEEARGLQALLEEAEGGKAEGDSASLFSMVSGAGHVTLHAVALDYDAKSPRFGAGPRDSSRGLYVDWAAADCGMLKGDRLMEVNGKQVVACKSREDLQRLLAVSPSPAQLVVLRARSDCECLGAKVRAEEAERDNVRLSHRISYLEEQVADLQKRAVISADGQLQVFQKGPQVTALVANLPGMGGGGPRHSLPTVRPKSRGGGGGGSDAEAQHQHLMQPRSRRHIAAAHSLLELELERPQKPHRARHAKPLDYSSEPAAPAHRPTPPPPQQRPTPPKKPLRLSLHRATSLQTVATAAPVSSPQPQASEDQSRKAPAKRNHKGEATPSCQSALRWPSSLRRPSLVAGAEKWY